MTYSNHLNTRLVWYSNGIFVSGCQMVRFFEWWSENWTEKACLWSKMSGVRIVRQVMWLPFEYWTPILSGIQMNLVLRCWVFRWLLYQTSKILRFRCFCYSDVCYSDPHCLVLIPRKLNNSWMAAELSHLLSVDKIKHKYEKTVKIYFAI